MCSSAMQKRATTRQRSEIMDNNHGSWAHIVAALIVGLFQIGAAMISSKTSRMYHPARNSDAPNAPRSMNMSILRALFFGNWRGLVSLAISSAALLTLFIQNPPLSMRWFLLAIYFFWSASSVSRLIFDDLHQRWRAGEFYKPD